MHIVKDTTIFQVRSWRPYFHINSLFLAETDPVKKQELTNLYLNEDMDRKELQKKGIPLS